jgi:hypothetical protein
MKPFSSLIFTHGHKPELSTMSAVAVFTLEDGQVV